MNPFRCSPYYLKILYFVYLYLEFFYDLIHFHAGDHNRVARIPNMNRMIVGNRPLQFKNRNKLSQNNFS